MFKAIRHPPGLSVFFHLEVKPMFFLHFISRIACVEGEAEMHSFPPPHGETQLASRPPRALVLFTALIMNKKHRDTEARGQPSPPPSRKLAQDAPWLLKMNSAARE